MSRGKLSLPVIGAALAMLPAAAAQQARPKGVPRAEASPSTSETLAGKRVGPDYKVVFWLTRTGLRHQVYDVRKGQYTKAVDDWVHRPEIQFDASGFVRPARLATVRDVYLAVERGKTQGEKLAAAIRREEGRILGLDRPRQPSPYYFVPHTPYAYRPLRLSADRYGRESSPLGLSTSPSTSPGFIDFSPSSPVPVPYPRPHP